jgi:predicted lipopolysaccharide heptosyltransferase III
MFMIVKNNHLITGDIHNILIIQLGDIGDVVWTTPTLWAIKAKYPNAHMSVLLREGIGNLLQEDPSIDKIFEVKKHRGNLMSRTVRQLRFIRELRKTHYDLVIDLRADDRGAIMSFLTGARIRGAQFYTGLPFWRNRLFTHLVDSIPPMEKILGASEQSLRVIRGFGIDAKTRVPRLWVSDQVTRTAHRLLIEYGIESEMYDSSCRFMTINPFSRWTYKEWTHEKWVSVIDWLWEEFNIPAVIVGSGEEAERAAGLVKKCSRVAYNLAGKTTLAELAGILSLSGFHLGVDSAAPHIAAAVGTPTLTIYGPSDWRDWAPVGDKHRVVMSRMDCVPCHKKGCTGSERSLCLDTLEVSTVQDAIREMLGKG